MEIQKVGLKARYRNDMRVTQVAEGAMQVREVLGSFYIQVEGPKHLFSTILTVWEMKQIARAYHEYMKKEDAL